MKKIVMLLTLALGIGIGSGQAFALRNSGNGVGGGAGGGIGLSSCNHFDSEYSVESCFFETVQAQPAPPPAGGPDQTSECSTEADACFQTACIGCHTRICFSHCYNTCASVYYGCMSN